MPTLTFDSHILNGLAVKLDALRGALTDDELNHLMALVVAGSAQVGNVSGLSWNNKKGLPAPSFQEVFRKVAQSHSSARMKAAVDRTLMDQCLLAGGTFFQCYWWLTHR